MHSFISAHSECQHFSGDSEQGLLNHIHLYQHYENCDYSLLLPWHRFELTLFYPNTFLNLILEYNISSLLQFDWNHENVFLTNCKYYNLSIEEIALSDKLFIEKRSLILFCLHKMINQKIPLTGTRAYHQIIIIKWGLI